MSARLEIQALLTRYTIAIDTHDWEPLDTVFDADAWIDYESARIDAAHVYQSGRHIDAGQRDVGRADILCANTPAAKGRVERAHLTLQDRLVKELRLRGISDVEAANAFAPEFIADYNRRFARAPRSEHDAHRPVQPSDDLARIFSWQETRRTEPRPTRTPLARPPRRRAAARVRPACAPGPCR